MDGVVQDSQQRLVKQQLVKQHLVNVVRQHIVVAGVLHELLDYLQELSYLLVVKVGVQSSSLLLKPSATRGLGVLKGSQVLP